MQPEDWFSRNFKNYLEMFLVEKQPVFKFAHLI
jgi:hypothetical protein